MLVKAKTKIVLDKTYHEGQTLELTEKQFELLKDYVIVQEQKEEVKAKKPSTKGKSKKTE